MANNTNMKETIMSMKKVLLASVLGGAFAFGVVLPAMAQAINGETAKTLVCTQ